MDALLFWSLASVIANVILLSWTAWIARRAESADTRKAVDELAETVERFTRIARRETMRRVRAATPGAEARGDDLSPPPELNTAAAAPLSKSDLRRMLIRRA